ncbi:hypothetical protein T265_03332 [Opisthorchis viverrini]|uniref:Uncharacterized protein n=2 Tax=Opisthorchis viverrini TaxID=6198 RepID=A0A074ZSX0_OPIVI|nr:hypothetical protein T265_03332 [Opisthorchis viverrini]KER30176.1 hypothetical protein T265_03332 [Opisthorchis viverrini]
MRFPILVLIHLRLSLCWPSLEHEASTELKLDLLEACYNSTVPVCDPQNVLSASERQRLQINLSSVGSRTICLCSTKCTSNGEGASKRLVIGTVFLKSLLPQHVSGIELAEEIRSRWSLGSCPGNDVIMLVSEAKIFLAYGPLVSQKLVPTCMKSLPTTYEVRGDAERLIRRLIYTLKTFFVHSCICGNCETPQLWFKIVAMLLACMSLLMWLSLFGRRAYLRRTTLFTARGRYSLSNVNSGYADRTSLFPAPSRLFHPHQLPPQLLTTSRATRIGGLSRPHQDSTERIPPPVRGRESPPPPSYSSIVKPCSLDAEPVHHEVPKLVVPETPSETGPTRTVTEPPSYTEVLEFSRQPMRTVVWHHQTHPFAGHTVHHELRNGFTKYRKSNRRSSERS